MRSFAALVAALCTAASFAAAQVNAVRPAFPLKASADGRYLVDQQGRPFFYHADTAWCVVKKLTLEEFESYLDRRAADGFTTVHLHAFTKEHGPVENRAGEAPFGIAAGAASAPEGHPPEGFAEDLTRPNEPYWRHLDAMLDAVERCSLLAVVSAAWIRWGGKDREGWRWQLRDDVAETYGRFLGTRYQDQYPIATGSRLPPPGLARATRHLGRPQEVIASLSPGHVRRNYFYTRGHASGIPAAASWP